MSDHFIPYAHVILLINLHHILSFFDSMFLAIDPTVFCQGRFQVFASVCAAAEFLNAPKEEDLKITAVFHFTLSDSATPAE